MSRTLLAYAARHWILNKHEKIRAQRMETKRLLAHLCRGLEEKIGDGELEESSHPHGKHHIRDAQLRAFARRHSTGYHRRRIFAQCRHQHQRQIAHIACALQVSNTTLREGPVDRSALSKKLIKTSMAGTIGTNPRLKWACTPAAMEQMTCGCRCLGALSTRAKTHPMPMPTIMLHSTQNGLNAAC